jgi:hypothetical protein
MDADSEDEFLGRVMGLARGLMRSGGAVRGLAQRAMPAARGLMQWALPRVGESAGRAGGGWVGQRAGGWLGEQVGGQTGRRVGGYLGESLGRGFGSTGGEALGNWLSQMLAAQAQSFDAFADLAAENYDESDDGEAFIGTLGGLAGRLVLRTNLARAAAQAVRRAAGSAPARAVVARAVQAARPRAVAQARAATQAVTRASQALVRRGGAPALRALPTLMRQVIRVIRSRGASPRDVARRILGLTRQLVRNPANLRQVARPTQAARRLRQVAGVPAGRPLPPRVRIRPRGVPPVASPVAPAAVRGRRPRSIVVNGPFRITLL